MRRVDHLKTWAKLHRETAPDLIPVCSSPTKTGIFLRALKAKRTKEHRAEAVDYNVETANHGCLPMGLTRMTCFRYIEHTDDCRNYVPSIELPQLGSGISHTISIDRFLICLDRSAIPRVHWTTDGAITRRHYRGTRNMREDLEDAYTDCLQVSVCLRG